MMVPAARMCMCGHNQGRNWEALVRLMRVRRILLVHSCPHLVHISEAHLDGAAGVLDAGDGRGARATIVSRHLNSVDLKVRDRSVH